jgi:hypothetical protein
LFFLANQVFGVGTTVWSPTVSGEDHS